MAYEFSGAKYDKASGHQQQWGERLLAELSLDGGEHILDLGCGNGRLSADLAALVPQGRVTAIDTSRGMLEFARENYAAANLSFEAGDIAGINYTESFDLVFSNAALHWVPGHSELLHRVFKALRPGGKVRFNFAASGNCTNFFREVRAVMRFPEFSRYFADFSWPWYMPEVSEYQELLAAGEFKKFKVWGENADHYFSDAAAITGWVEQPSLVPFMGFLPADIKENFRDIVVQRVIEATQQVDGRCFENFRRINMLAEK